MVKPFQFARLPVIYFGVGKVTLLPGLVKKYGSTIILVTGKSSFLNSAKYGILVDALSAHGIKHHNVIIPAEPSAEIIDATVKSFRDIKVDVVVGAGGGSVLDAGKAISAMIYRDEPVKSFLEGVGDREHPGTKIPFIARADNLGYRE